MTTPTVSEIGLYSVTGDKDECSTCSFLAVCHLGERGWDCIMPKTNSTEVAIVVRTTEVAQLDDVLGQVLSLQAQRVQTAMNNPPDDSATPKQRADFQKELDRNINNLFKNGMSLRNAKAASKTPSKAGVVLDSDGKEVPKHPTSELLSWALDDMEKAGLDRRSLGRQDAVAHLRDCGKILPEAPEDVEF